MKISVYLFFMVSSVSFSVFSDENVGPDDNQLLLTSCQTITTAPEQENAKSCIYFIQGFLAAAQAIDPPIVNQHTRKNRKPIGVMSRSYYSAWEKIPPTRFFPFCVPENESKAHITMIVSKQISTHKINSTKALRDIIFQALKAEYPCT